MIEFYNRDCLEAMKDYPDGYFDLAIVDPVYGDVSKGGYMTRDKEELIGSSAAKSKAYHLALWDQNKTGPDYFKELLRVSKNQIVWGGITSLSFCLVHNAGSYGINNTQLKDRLLIVN